MLRQHIHGQMQKGMFCSVASPTPGHGPFGNQEIVVSTESALHSWDWSSKLFFKKQTVRCYKMIGLNFFTVPGVQWCCGKGGGVMNHFIGRGL